MRKSALFAASIFAVWPHIGLAQIDPDWSQREMERMQAQQERFDAQVERQKAEQERFSSRFDRQQAQQDRGVAQTDPAESGGGFGVLIERLNHRALRKKIGRLLAAGDCQGAAKMAYEKGWIEMGSNIQQGCDRSTEE